MTKKFQNKYRDGTVRLRNWNYGRNACYFVTICTQDREHFFGRIVDGKMKLSEIGRIADQCWQEIPEHFPFVKLHEFVVMPNHVHGIIQIDKPGDVDIVGAQDFAHLQYQQPLNKFGPQSKNLASIIRGFKVGVTKNTRKINVDFAWQLRYYDHIIRDEKSFFNISQYIANNPANWEEDEFYRSSLSTSR